MSGSRLADYLEHMRQAALDACDFVDGMAKDDFLTDRRTQQAVIMSLVIIGEAATKITQLCSQFVEAQPELAWQGMRGMRNRIIQGYFKTNLEVVWDTVESAMPKLLEQLSAFDPQEIAEGESR